MHLRRSGPRYQPVPGWLFLRWWVLDTRTGEYIPAPNDPLSFQGAKAKAEALAARLNREH